MPLFSMSFLEAGGLRVGKNLSEWRVFWRTLAVLSAPGRVGQHNAGPEAGAARLEARATSERLNSFEWPKSFGWPKPSERPNSGHGDGKPRVCSTCLAADFIFEVRWSGSCRSFTRSLSDRGQVFGWSGLGGRV